MKSPNLGAVTGLPGEGQRGLGESGRAFLSSGSPLPSWRRQNPRTGLSHTQMWPSNTSGWEVNVCFPGGSGEEGGLVLHSLAEYRVTSAPAH